MCGDNRKGLGAEGAIVRGLWALFSANGAQDGAIVVFLSSAHETILVARYAVLLCSPSKSHSAVISLLYEWYDGCGRAVFFAECCVPRNNQSVPLL